MFASDVLYEKEYAELLPLILRRVLAASGRSLIADPGRVAAPVFVESCGRVGLVIQEKETRPFEVGAREKCVVSIECQAPVAEVSSTAYR